MNHRQRRAAGHRGPLHIQLRPAAAPETPCPDCGAEVDGRELLHESGCPISEGVDKVTAEDAAWFEANPDQHTRIRRMCHAERLQFAHTDDSYSHPVWRERGFVCVRQVKPGLRLREPLLLVRKAGES